MRVKSVNVREDSPTFWSEEAFQLFGHGGAAEHAVLHGPADLTEKHAPVGIRGQATQRLLELARLSLEVPQDLGLLLGRLHA